MFLFFSVLLFIALLLQGSVTTIPLVLVCLLCLLIMKKGATVFFLAFAVGLLLDIFSVRILGGSSLFFIVFLFLILLYQRKYEIYSYPFVFFASFLGSVIFLVVFNYGGWFWQSLISSILAVVFFGILKKFSLLNLQSNRNDEFLKI